MVGCSVVEVSLARLVAQWVGPFRKWLASDACVVTSIVSNLLFVLVGRIGFMALTVFVV